MRVEPEALESVAQFAATLGLGDAAQIHLSVLSGGVSSDVWKAVGPKGVACIKRALPTLRVAKRWDVPVRRGEFEARWLETACAIAPTSVPRILGYDHALHLIGMQFFAAEQYPNWRDQMLAGHVDRHTAGAMGHLVGSIHAATVGKPMIEARFDSDELFDALRLDPYFRSLQTSHPDLKVRLAAIIERTASTRRALVHGDVSPKNVLVGECGPVLLDAECAWFGDPAFDLAFLCTHLLLKVLVVPSRATDLKDAFTDYVAAYESQVTWEPLTEIRERSADLLVAMLLARIDGKSPVDYLNALDRIQVRNFARDRLIEKCISPNTIADAWHSLLQSRPGAMDHSGCA
jgi:5-methylthioribose kinase